MQAVRDLATMANKLNNTTGVEIPGLQMLEKNLRFFSIIAINFNII